jgi:hypothetical protein
MLYPGGAVTTTITWTVSMTPGLYTAYAIVDPDNKIPEYDETNNIVTRTLRVAPYDPESIPAPFLTINHGAQIADSPQVMLNVTTTQEVDYILYVEYQYVQEEDNWRPVDNSGWLPYAEAGLDYSWSLMPTSGIHYMQAWVADTAGHISLLPGMAYINYVPPSDHVAEREVHIYRYRINAGERLLVRLSSLSGDADLYIWNPDGSLIGTSQTTDPVEQLFVIATGAPRICQIEVEGATAADYSLEIVPMTIGTRLDDVPSDDPGTLKPEGKGRSEPYSLLPPPDDVGLPTVPAIMLYLPLAMKY